MVRFDADVTDPPAFSTSSPVNTLRNWAGYIIVAGLMFVALGIAQGTVAPWIGGLLGSVGVGNQDDNALQLGA